MTTSARVSWWWAPSVLVAGLAARHITEQWITAEPVSCGVVFVIAAAFVYIIAKRLAGAESKKMVSVLVGMGILIGSWGAIAISNEAFISRYAPGSAATQTQPAGTLSWDAEVQAWSEQNQDFLATPGAKELLQAEINSTSSEYSHNISDRDLIELAGLRARQKMKAAAAESAPLILPSYLKLTPVDHDPFTAPPEKKKGPEPFVKRGWFGRCPTGYVDHPADPKKCALPHVAERMLERARASGRSR